MRNKLDLEDALENEKLVAFFTYYGSSLWSLNTPFDIHDYTDWSPKKIRIEIAMLEAGMEFSRREWELTLDGETDQGRRWARTPNRAEKERDYEVGLLDYLVLTQRKIEALNDLIGGPPTVLKKIAGVLRRKQKEQ